MYLEIEFIYSDHMICTTDMYSVWAIICDGQGICGIGSSGRQTAGDPMNFTDMYMTKTDKE